MIRKDLVAVILAGLAYSLLGFAYMHSTFPSKDVISMMVERLTRIELKLDKVIDNGR